MLVMRLQVSTSAALGLWIAHLPDLKLNQADDQLQVVFGAVVDFLEQHFLLQQQLILLKKRSPQLKLGHDLPGQNHECRLLFVCQRSRLTVQYAQRAQAMTFSGLQQAPCIETQPGVGGDQRVEAHSGVFAQIGNDRQSGLQQHMPADRHIQRRLVNAQTDLGLEPLAVVFDQVDD